MTKWPILIRKSLTLRGSSALGQFLLSVAKRFRSLTLKTRVVVLVAMMLIVGIWGLALRIALVLQHDLAQSQAAILSAEVQNVADDLDRDIRMHIDTLGRLAASLTPAVLTDAAKLDQALDQFTDSSVIAPNACFVASQKGIITAGYPGHSVGVGTSVADTGYFREVIRTGKPVIGSPIATATTENRPAMPIAVPLRYSAGATPGALVGLVLLSDPNIFGQLRQSKLGRTGFFVLMSPKDRLRLIASGIYQNEVMTPLPPRGVNALLDRRLDEGFEGPGITVSSYGVEVLNVSRRLESTGWMLLAGVPTDEIFAPITDLKRQIYSAALLISFAMVAVLWFMLARQLAPLAQAGRAMRRMTDGEMPMAPIPVRRQDEIGELIANFNRLVAERSRLEHSLSESKNRLEGIYRSVGDGIISVDDAQCIVLFNAAAERMFGYSAREIMGQPLSVLMPERFRIGHEVHVRRFADTGASNRGMGAYGPIFGRRASGEEFPVEATVSQSGSGSDKLFTVILRDITERNKAERAREQLMRQLELLSERLATAQEDERRKIAYELHEGFGQELTTLQLYLQMLGGGSGATDAKAHREEALAVIAQALERVRKLVDDLDPLELENFGLYAAIRKQCQRLAIAGRWTMHAEAEKPDNRAPRAVERVCFHVLCESLDNVLRHAQASEVWVDFRQDADELELTIRDNGVGFDRSASHEPNGAGGLGLLAMETRVHQQGGQLEINSSPGAGTVIRTVFPLRSPRAEPA